MRATSPLALASASPRKTPESSVLIGPCFPLHLGCFENHVLQGIFFLMDYQTTVFWPNSCEPVHFWKSIRPQVTRLLVFF
jgi:hypothetical protein